MEAFIERSNALLSARPDTARVSTRYTHKHVAQGGERVDSTAKPAKVVVKTYDPKSGLIYKYKVKKANELSRILASLGPQHFEFENHRKVGLASVMADVEPKDSAETAEAPASEPQPTVKEAEPVVNATPKSKKKKSKKK